VQRSLSAYAISTIALAVVVLLRWLLDPLLGHSLPLVTLYGAVAVAVWAGGYRPAVLVGLVGYFACNYLFIEPRGRFGPVDAQTIVGLLAYAFTCSLIIAIGEAMRRARQRASKRGELLRVTLGSIGDAVLSTDVDGRVTYLNAVAESLTGWKSEDALGHQVAEVFRIVDEKKREPVENPVTRALRDGIVTALANHTVLIARDGVERPIDDSAAPIKDDHGRVAGCVLIFRDISERRRWEQQDSRRLSSARLLASIVESSDDAIISKSLDGIIQSWNTGAERLLGYSAEEALGRHISLIIPTDRIAEEDHIIASLKAGRRVEHFETERVRKDGTSIQLSLTVSPVRDAEGNVTGASKIARDITERKRAEAERQKFVTLVENSTDFVGICDLDGVPFYINQAGLKIVGLEGIEEARRTQVRDFFFPEDQSKVMDEFFPSVIERGHGELEIRFRNFRTGVARWMAYKVLVLKDATGRNVAFATVSQDVTERRRLDDDLRKLATDLSEADRRKNQFLATLAHELRNPLAPLRNMVEILKRAGGDRDVLKRAVDTMERQLGQMVRLVDDLLDMNRITHDRLELRKGHVELAHVIEQAIEASRPLADAAGHDLRSIVPSEPIYLHADAARLEQVFANLLNNSCKYTNPGGKITITATRDGKDALVTVTDNGIGIPPDKLDSIFEIFTQVDESVERSQGGLGIGLTLVRRLVQMHGGTVEAKNLGDGVGSEFVVRLPASDATETAQVQAATDAHLRPHRILIVDDNEDTAASLAALLKITGHETYVAHDGLAALEAAETHRPEVMLLDIGLPVLNGYEVCRRVRQQPWGKDIVLIAQTGWGQDEDRSKSRAAGFDGHLVKPVDYGALMSLLSSLVANRNESTSAWSPQGE
jgi:PAS domain S-box-containing protein